MFAVNDTATELDKLEERLCKAPPPLARSLAAQCLSPCGHRQASLVLFQNKPPFTGDQTAPHEGAACDEGRGAPLTPAGRQG